MIIFLDIDGILNEISETGEVSNWVSPPVLKKKLTELKNKHNAKFFWITNREYSPFVVYLMTVKYPFLKFFVKDKTTAKDFNSIKIQKFLSVIKKETKEDDLDKAIRKTDFIIIDDQPSLYLEELTALHLSPESKSKILKSIITKL